MQEGLLQLVAGEGSGGQHGGIFLGAVQLSEVVQPLAAVGVRVEWRTGGGLLCNGLVTVRKEGEEGTLVVEGPLCADYYTVREVVYGQLRVC